MRSTTDRRPQRSAFFCSRWRYYTGFGAAAALRCVLLLLCDRLRHLVPCQADSLGDPQPHGPHGLSGLACSREREYKSNLPLLVIHFICGTIVVRMRVITVCIHRAAGIGGPRSHAKCNRERATDRLGDGGSGRVDSASFSSGAVSVLPVAWSAIAQTTMPDRSKLIVADGSSGLFSLQVSV